jgi:membrane protein
LPRSWCRPSRSRYAWKIRSPAEPDFKGSFPLDRANTPRMQRTLVAGALLAAGALCAWPAVQAQDRQPGDRSPYTKELVPPSISTPDSTVISVGLLSVLFAVIYKVLPDRDLEWGDVMVGAVVTAILFTIGKSLIGWYIGSSAVASTYGAAGALMVLLLWVYYSAQIFLLGAEFTKVYADRHGSKQIKA